MQPRSEPNGRVESAGGTSDGRAGLVYVVSNDPVLCENSAASEREQFRGLRGCRRLWAARQAPLR